MEFPISLNQERYVFSEKVTGNFYALPVSFRINGLLEIDRLKKGISLLLNKHEMLRCSIKVNDQAKYTNIIDPDIDFKLDMRSLKDANNEAICKEIEDYFFQKIDYTANELVKFQVLELSQNETIFTFSAHHTVADGVSIGVIIRDLSSFYNNVNIETIGQLTAKEKVTYQEYCVSVDKQFSINSAQSKNFWQVSLAGFPENSRLLMYDNIYAERDTGHGCFESVLSRAHHDEVKSVAKSFGASTFSFYMSLFHIALSRMMSANSIVSVFQSSGRQKYESYSDVVGVFSNALIFCTEIDETLSFKDYCKNINEKVSGLVENQGYPYHYVSRDTEIHPSIGFNWYPIYDSLALNGCSSKQEEFVSWRSDLDINVHCILQNGELQIKTHFNREVYQHVTMEVLNSHFIKLIQSAVRKPEDAISMLNSISDLEKKLMSCSAQ